VIPGGGGRFGTSDPGDWFGFGPPGANRDGRLAFVARELADGQTVARDALYRYTPAGQLERVGDPIPGGDLGDIYDVKHAPAVNAQGDIALITASGGESIVLVYRGATAVQIARTGESAPAGGFYSHLSWQPSLNDRGDVLFGARLRQGTTSMGAALFLAGADGIRTIAQRGQAPPEGGGVFSELVSSDYFSLVTGHRPHLNARGQVAFMASIEEGGAAPALGLYVHDGVTLRKVVRTGDILDGKVVAEVGFGSVVSPGVQAFNDACQITFLVHYADDTYAIWLRDACASAQ
jgi:hypothetical protein